MFNLFKAKPKRRLITAALPYVNNEPHLGTLLQVLSADVFARYCRQKGYETLYICGNDEYGTATETKAQELKTTPKELCDRFHKLHKQIYSEFNIKFDYFGRTSDPEHIKVVQGFFYDVYNAGYIVEKESEQLYCPNCKKFLADRFVVGKCPHCSSDAKGDQCESCGKMLDPTELVDPSCSICGAKPVVKKTKHLYLDLPRLSSQIDKFVDKCGSGWAQNAKSLTKGWIKQGLEERCITRDLKWGVPVPLKGWEDKVFYVWFDANIGYLTFTQLATGNWKDWWQNPKKTELYQFIGKDNIPFHTIVFPSEQIASGKKSTMVTNMSSTEYINYEGGKFSKSRGVGVFGSDIKKTGIPIDAWRFYLIYNRPEKQDYNFTWAEFADKVNGELIGNLSNLINRVVVFIQKNFNGTIDNYKINNDFWNTVLQGEKSIEELMEKVLEKDAFRKIFELSDCANKFFQENEPWKLVKTEEQKCKNILGSLASFIREVGIMISPFMPETAGKILSLFTQKSQFDWKLLGTPLNKINLGELKGHLFDKIEKDRCEELKLMFSGAKGDVKNNANTFKNKGSKMDNTSGETLSMEEEFNKRVILRVSNIVNVQKHPEGDKLYILTLNTGDTEERIIVSAIVKYYKPEELMGHNIIIVYNLKPANFRGVKSRGMITAVTDPTQPEGETCEVLFADDIDVGTVLIPEGFTESAPLDSPYVKIEKFETFKMNMVNGVLRLGEKRLLAGGREIKSHKILNGVVN